MTTADIPLGLKLARQAGWNQIEPDWRRFLTMQPDGCFVGELDGTAVATTAAFIFGSVAWIAMVLVDIDSRRKGVATTLLKHALDFLDEQGVKTVRLDATAAGQPVYEKLGFVPEYPLTRYMGTVEPSPRPSGLDAATHHRPATESDRGLRPRNDRHTAREDARPAVRGVARNYPRFVPGWPSGGVRDRPSRRECDPDRTLHCHGLRRANPA